MNASVIPRAWERTFAVISWDGDIEPCDLLEHLKDAVTEWVRTTPEGMKSWEECSHDLNIADLANVLDDPTLMKLLTDQGILKLQIEVFSDADSYQDPCFDYDTVLVRQKGGRYP